MQPELKSRRLWFLNSLIHIWVAEADGSDGLTVLEHTLPPGDSPPLHIHQREDEVFRILDGEFRFQISGETRRCGPGSVLLAPKGVPHTYRVESPAGARFLTITAHGDFERLVRKFGRTAERDELPPPSSPTPEAIAQLTEAARSCGIDLVGPPLD